MYDRLRAKPPSTDVDSWREGTVRDVNRAEGGYVVTVTTADGDAVEVTVTEAVFELFASRLTTGYSVPADAIGEPAWFK